MSLTLAVFLRASRVVVMTSVDALSSGLKSAEIKDVRAYRHLYELGTETKRSQLERALVINVEHTQRNVSTP